MQNTDSQPPRLSRRLFRKLWGALPVLLLIAALALLAVLGIGIRDRKEELTARQAEAMRAERPPVNVVVMELEPNALRDRLSLPGMLEPWTDLSLLAKVGGEVVSVAAQEGDFLAAGQEIGRIDPADYRIRLDSARAARKLAESDLERNRTLAARGLIPKAELDLLETRVETSRATEKDAALQLERCTITAPMAGVVRRLDIKVGSYLSVGDPLGRILRVDKLKAVVGIPESDVAAVRDLDAVSFSVEALGGGAFTGRRHFLASSPESVARLYRLELEVDNPGGALLPGMFLRAEIVKAEAGATLAVPLYAVVSRNDEQYVYVEEKGLAHKRPVELGILDGWLVQVTEGLAAGDRVIVEGHRTVENGQAVSVVQAVTASGEKLP